LHAAKLKGACVEEIDYRASRGLDKSVVRAMAQKSTWAAQHENILGKALGGATVAVIQGSIVFVVCLIAGFRPVNISALPTAFLFMALIATMFTSLGTVIGSVLVDMQGFQLVMNFLVMPIFFLSGALFPLANLPKALAIVTRLDPLTYGVDGLRATLIGISHFGIATDIAVICAITAVFMGLGTYFFSRIQL
jgi:ABC-2 type transport system permease protein